MSGLGITAGLGYRSPISRGFRGVPQIIDPTFSNWDSQYVPTNYVVTTPQGPPTSFCEDGTNALHFVCAAGESVYISPTAAVGNVRVEAGADYRYKIVIDSVSSGTLGLRIGGSSQAPVLSAPGTYEGFRLNAESSGSWALWRASSPVDMVISYFQMWRIA